MKQKEKKYPYSKLFVLSRIRTEYGEIRSISPYLVGMGENMDQNNSEYGHFSRSDSLVDASRNLYLSVKANLTKIEIKTSKYEPSIRLCKVLDPSLIVQYLKQNDISLSLSL